MLHTFTKDINNNNNNISQLDVREVCNLKKSVKKKLFVPFIVLTLVLISFLSGCFGPVATIRTVGWEHANLEGTTVKLEGDLN